MAKAISKNRTQRFRTLENELRKLAKSIKGQGDRVGEILLEIRKDELWDEEYESFADYLRHVGVDFFDYHVKTLEQLVRTAEVRLKLQESEAPVVKLGTSALDEIVRLAPEKKNVGERQRSKDISKLKQKDVERVLEAAEEKAESEGRDKPTVKHIRAAVDDELGIDRKKIAAEKRKKQAEEMKIDLTQLLRDTIDDVQSTLNLLGDVPGEYWERIGARDKKLMAKLADVCDELSGFLRS